MSKISIKIECRSCSATGIYCGFMEGPGEGVICVDCRGRGYETVSGTVFTKRKRRNKVTKVRASTGLFIDNPRTTDWIPYEEFLRRF